MGRQLNFIINQNTNILIMQDVLRVLEEPVLWKWSGKDKADLQPLPVGKRSVEAVLENKSYASCPQGILLFVSENVYHNKVAYEYENYKEEYIIQLYQSPVIEYRFYLSPDLELTWGRIAAFYNPKEYPALEKKFNNIRRHIQKIIKDAGAQTL